jgi:hypothetical protein
MSRNGCSFSNMGNTRKQEPCLLPTFSQLWFIKHFWSPDFKTLYVCFNPLNLWKYAVSAIRNQYLSNPLFYTFLVPIVYIICIFQVKWRVFFFLFFFSFLQKSSLRFIYHTFSYVFLPTSVMTKRETCKHFSKISLNHSYNVW